MLDVLGRSEISAGHARALLPLGAESEQIEFCEKIRNDGLSVRNIEQLVQEHLDATEPDTIEFPSGEPRRKRTKSNQVASLEQQLRIVLGTKVEIKQTERGSGRIIIHFKNSDEFERLQWRLVDDDSSTRDIA